jgi:dihydrofolate reductase
MGDVIVMMSVSLDGFMEGPDRDIGWHRVDEELHTHFNQRLAAMRAFLDGRVTWELMAGYWPAADQDPDSSPAEAEFSRVWREMPKIVYSRTLQEAGWNTTIVREVVPEEVQALKAEPGDLALGGADLAAAFERHGLIDEYSLYVNPVVLGAGKPLFSAENGRVDLRLVETRTFGNGVVLLRYRRPGTGTADEAGLTTLVPGR